MQNSCPNCRASEMEVFYECPGVPVHSCMMLGDRRAAEDYRTGDLALGYCGRCGFISNTAFDPTLQEYTSGYEAQQSFSPRFREFQSDLIRRLIDRYDLRDKDVVEIGCGKGDFLVELCQAGGNRGIGIDPACEPGRLGSAAAAARVRLIPESYSEAHSDLPCDVLCCRHTLEHIHTTDAFVGGIRRVVGDRTDTLVMIEVPDVGRVLHECAYWDVYYEHCSYFTLGSLARLFRANRFDILELATDYDGQYLLLVARASRDVTPPHFAEEDDIADTTSAVKAFTAEVQATISRWRSRISSLRKAGRRIAIWGSGSKCVSFLSTVGVSAEIDRVVDINPHRQGRYLAGSGIQVVAPESLAANPPHTVIIMNPIYRLEIQQTLAALGLTPELVCL